MCTEVPMKWKACHINFLAKIWRDDSNSSDGGGGVRLLVDDDDDDES